jgi:chromosomal replication initiator protein
MNAQQAWQAALGELQLQLTKPTFDTWVKNTYVISWEDGTFLIGTRNGYAKDWLENRLLTTIKRTLSGILGRTVEIKFVVRPKRGKKESPAPALLTDVAERSRSQPNAAQHPSFNTGLNHKHTFETFIVGNANRLAHAAARSVAENLAKQYNPLFVYGGVGLGKTHLLQAIGNLALSYTPYVLYVSSETFTNELINAIRTQSTEEFRAKYRNHVDLLLIDDIQFIGGKESTQEEFFHTFNTLHQAGRQIVMSSDRPPRAIVTLEERLRSRFEQGLIVDIQPPDFETRIAILRTKAEAYPIAIPPDVLTFIARKFQSNVRELEGALNRVVAHALLNNEPLAAEMAAAVLQDILTRADSITSDQVLDAVCRHYGLDATTLKSRQRCHEVALARQVAMYLLKEELNWSLPQIGQTLGGRDHTTVLYGCQKIKDGIEENDELRRNVLLIKEQLYRESIPAARQA